MGDKSLKRLSIRDLSYEEMRAINIIYDRKYELTACWLNYRIGNLEELKKLGLNISTVFSLYEYYQPRKVDYENCENTKPTSVLNAVCAILFNDSSYFKNILTHKSYLDSDIEYNELIYRVLDELLLLRHLGTSRRIRETIRYIIHRCRPEWITQL